MMAAIGSVNVIVETPAQAVDAQLLIALFEAGEEDFPEVGFTVTIGVFGIDNVGSSCDEGAFFPAHDTSGEVEAFEEERGLVEDAIVVGVAEETNPSTGFSVDAGGVVGHFSDPETTVRSPVDGDGILDEGFGGHELDFVSIGDVNGFEGIGRRERLGVPGAGESEEAGGVSLSEGSGEPRDFIDASFDGEGASEAPVIRRKAGKRGGDFRLAIEEDRDGFTIGGSGEVMPMMSFDERRSGEGLIRGLEDEVAFGLAISFSTDPEAKVVVLNEVAGFVASGSNHAIPEPKGEASRVWNSGRDCSTDELKGGVVCYSLE